METITVGYIGFRQKVYGTSGHAGCEVATVVPPWVATSLEATCKPERQIRRRSDARRSLKCGSPAFRV